MSGYFEQPMFLTHKDARILIRRLPGLGRFRLPAEGKSKLICYPGLPAVMVSKKGGVFVFKRFEEVSA